MDSQDFAVVPAPTGLDPRVTQPSGRVLLLIPARGGSKGVPGKNLRLVDGVTLVGRAILHAIRFQREAALPDARIVVDTDDEEIAREARSWGAWVPFLRPAELASDTTTTVASTLHLLDRLAAEGWKADHIILLQPTSPLRSWIDVGHCWQRYTDRRGTAVVAISAATKSPQLAMSVAGDGTLTWLTEPPVPHARRQDFLPAAYVNGSVYVIRANILRAERRFVTPGATIACWTGSAASVDIDSPSDLLHAEQIAQFVGSGADALSIRRLVASEDDRVTLTADHSSGTPQDFPVFEQVSLREVIRPGTSFSGVVLRPTQDPAPGPATWREALGCEVGMLIETTRSGVPFSVISADFLAISPEINDGVLQSMLSLIDSARALRRAPARPSPALQC